MRRALLRQDKIWQPRQTPMIAAVETTDDGKPRRIGIRSIVWFKRKSVRSLAKRMVAAGSTVLTDGLACFRGIADNSEQLVQQRQRRNLFTIITTSLLRADIQPDI